MTHTVPGQRIRPMRCSGLLVWLHLAASSRAAAQRASVIGDATLAPWGDALTNGDVQAIDGRLLAVTSTRRSGIWTEKNAS